MAKRHRKHGESRRKPGESGTKLAPVPLHEGPVSGRHHLPLAAMLVGLVLLVVVVVLYVARPEMPWLLQRLLGLVFVGLLVLVYMLATRHVETPEEVLFRLRRGQSADFGKRLRAAAQEPRRVRLPIVGEVRARTVGAVLVGVIGAVWWFSPLTPVGIRKLTVEDITFRLTDEIKAVILVMTDETVVLPQPPIVPATVRELAARITEQSDPYQRALKATAESRFDDARRLLATAADKKEAEQEKITLGRAINEMYAAGFPEAVRWYQELLLRQPDDTDLLCQAAVARMQAGEFDKAELLAEHAVEVCREKFAPDDEAWAPVLHVRAASLVVRHEALEEAHQAAGRSRDIWSEALGADHRFVAASRNNQAAIYLMQGKHSGALELTNWARESWTKNLGETHPYVAASLENLAQLEIAAGAYEEARRLLQRALEIRETAVGEAALPANHPILALSHDALARLAVMMGQYETAEPMAFQALQTAEKALGPEHPLVGTAADTLGALYTAQARYTKAEDNRLRALAIYEKTWGAEHPIVADTLAGLADLYLRQKQYSKVEEVLDRVQAILEKSYGKEDPRTAVVLVLRGRLELARGQPRAARPLLAEALKLLTKSHGQKHPEVARVLGYLAALNSGASAAAYQRGLGEYEKALAMAGEFFGNEHPEVARLWYGLAKLHYTAGKLAEAKAALKRALDIQRTRLTPFHPELAATYSAYAKVLAESQPPALQAAADMRRRAQEVLTLYGQENRPE